GVVGLVAVMLVTRDVREAEAATPPLAFILAIIGGAGFGVFFLALGETSSDAGLWPLVVARVVSIPVIGVVALVGSGGILIGRRPGRLSAVTGVSEMVATVFLLLALQRGPITVAVVIDALYPVPTVVLAWLVLREQLQRWQWAGVVLALMAIPLVAVG
ncbi:MAG: EamA family transporter, partial [Acidimicrobiia bacterium]|nr:EamA family transporter [Acidimicrobiia bacterium]